MQLAADIGHVLPMNPRTLKPLLPFDDASSDPDTIAAWFDRWPWCAIGVVAGPAGLAVLDLEHASKGGADGFSTIAALQEAVAPLPETRVHRTKSGGAHLVFALPRGTSIRSAQGKLRGASKAAPGIDIVAGRAVLRWPPMPGYTLLHDRPVETLPAAWIVALSDPPPPIVAPMPRRMQREDGGRGYALKALELEACELAELGAGRNCALARAAFKLGQLCPPLYTSEIEASLVQACEVNGSWREHGQRPCIATIARGLRSGMDCPRVIDRSAQCRT